MILIAEDNPLSAAWYAEIFKSVGIDSDTVEDGVSAVLRVAANDYDVVLMDWRIPGQSGVAAAVQIRRLEAPRNKVPIIVITGGMTHDDVGLLGEAAFDGVLQKPFMAADLIAMVKRLSESRVA